MTAGNGPFSLETGTWMAQPCDAAVQCGAHLGTGIVRYHAVRTRGVVPCRILACAGGKCRSLGARHCCHLVTPEITPSGAPACSSGAGTARGIAAASPSRSEGCAMNPRLVAPGSVLLTTVPIKNLHPLRNLQTPPLNLTGFKKKPKQKTRAEVASPGLLQGFTPRDLGVRQEADSARARVGSGARGAGGHPVLVLLRHSRRCAGRCWREPERDRGWRRSAGPAAPPPVGPGSPAPCPSPSAAVGTAT